MKKQSNPDQYTAVKYMCIAVIGFSFVPMVISWGGQGEPILVECGLEVRRWSGLCVVSSAAVWTCPP